MTTHYHHNPQVQVREDGDGAVLLHVESREYFELNGEAWALWKDLPEHDTEEALTGALCARGHRPEEAATYAREWLDEMVEAQLLTSDAPVRRRDRLFQKLGLRKRMR